MPVLAMGGGELSSRLGEEGANLNSLRRVANNVEGRVFDSMVISFQRKLQNV